MKNLQQRIETIFTNNAYDYKELIREIDLNYIFKNEEFDTMEEFQEKVQENYINTAQIIYYLSAIEYLKENDPSLQEAMEIASDMWFTTDKLSSELLASILYQSNLTDELNKLINELQEND